MITVCVPSDEVASSLGDLGEGARVVVWDPREGDAPADEKDRITIACIEHYSGGRTVFGRLAQCPNLGVIQLPSAGFEHALPHVPPGVALANARGVHDARVAEMALALILASQRLLPTFADAQRRHAWEPVYFTPGLADARVLIIGYGAIGAALGARLRACEVHVEGVGRAARVHEDGTRVHDVKDLASLVGDFDIVVVVTPHDASTDKLVGADVLAAMRDGALLVNVGRGKVVDTQALEAHVVPGRLRAALDVTDPEPLPPESPLWDAPTCMIVPHVAGGEPITSWRYARLVRAQVDALRAGEGPVNVVAVGTVAVV